MDNCRLVLDHLANACDAVVARMVIHSQLLFFVLDLGSDGEVNSALERREAKLGATLECITGVLSNRTDSVSRCLTERSAIVASKSANGIHNALEVLGGEVCGSQMLNHIIEDEESKFEAFLLLAAEAGRDDFVAQALYEIRDKLFVSLEERAHQLGSRDL